CLVYFYFYFFFSSRRRHTRSKRDWSSDVCSSDLILWIKRMGEGFVAAGEIPPAQAASALNTIAAWKGTNLNHERPILETELPLRSEERRVGKECRSGWWTA